jgi:hypothetical protein
VGEAQRASPNSMWSILYTMRLEDVRNNWAKPTEILERIFFYVNIVYERLVLHQSLLVSGMLRKGQFDVVDAEKCVYKDKLQLHDGNIRFWKLCDSPSESKQIASPIACSSRQYQPSGVAGRQTIGWFQLILEEMRSRTKPI